MSDPVQADELAELKIKLVNAQAEVMFWQDRCRAYEGNYSRLETSGADVRAAVERFLLVLGQVRPQGIDRT